MIMVHVRTYLSSFTHWHEWPIGDDPAAAAGKFAAWCRGRPWVDPASGAYVIPFGRLWWA
jgi:hypothetical protein